MREEGQSMLDADVSLYWAWVRAANSKNRSERILAERGMKVEYEAWARVGDLVDSGTKVSRDYLVEIAKLAQTEEELAFVVAGPTWDYMQSGGDLAALLASAEIVPQYAACIRESHS